MNKESKLQKFILFLISNKIIRPKKMHLEHNLQLNNYEFKQSKPIETIILVTISACWSAFFTSNITFATTRNITCSLKYVKLTLQN